MTDLRYILYVRKSSEDAERQTLSITDQRRTLGDMFPKLNIVSEVEETMSAFKPGRPKFNQMLDALRAGEADGIIAWHPDRLSRNEVDAGAITYAVRQGHVKDLKFGSYSFNNSPDGIMMLQSMMSHSQYYSAKLGVDVKRGNEGQRKRGWLTYRAPMGYLNTRNPNNPDQGIIVIDPDRFELCRKMWDLLLSGEWSVPAIIDVANNEWGFRTKEHRRSGGNPLSRSTLYQFFTNIRLAGKIPIPDKPGEYEDAAYQPMVTLAEYDRAQKILGDRGCPRQAPKREFAYRGFLRCGECGCSITAQLKHKRLKDGSIKQYTYYHCTRKKPCDQRKVVNEEILEEELYALLDSWTIHPKLEEWGLEAIREMNAQEASTRIAAESSQFKALEQARKQYDNLVNIMTKDLISEDVFKDKSKTLKTEIERLERIVEQNNDRASKWREGLEKIIDVLAHGRERFDNGGLAEKRDVLLALGSTPTVTDGKLELIAHDWLLPVQNGLPALKDQFDKVRTEPQQMKKASEEAVRSAWQG